MLKKGKGHLINFFNPIPEQHLVAKVLFPAEGWPEASSVAAGTLHGTPRFMEHLEDTGSGSLRMMNGGSSKKLKYKRFIQFQFNTILLTQTAGFSPVKMKTLSLS